MAMATQPQSLEESPVREARANTEALVAGIADGTIPASSKHKKLAKKMLAMDRSSAEWWNGLLVLEHLGIEAGPFMKDAPKGTAKIVYCEPSKITAIEQVRARRQAGGGKRTGAAPKDEDSGAVTRRFRQSLTGSKKPGSSIIVEKEPSLSKRLAIEEREVSEENKPKNVPWKADVNYKAVGTPEKPVRIKWTPERSDYVTPRERELAQIAQLLEAGHTAPEIAKKMGMPLRTVQRRITYLLNWPSVTDKVGAKKKDEVLKGDDPSALVAPGCISLGGGRLHSGLRFLDHSSTASKGGPTAIPTLIGFDENRPGHRISSRNRDPERLIWESTSCRLRSLMGTAL